MNNGTPIPNTNSYLQEINKTPSDQWQVGGFVNGFTNSSEYSTWLTSLQESCIIELREILLTLESKKAEQHYPRY